MYVSVAAAAAATAKNIAFFLTVTLRHCVTENSSFVYTSR